jgi:hypothetical protein
MKVTITNECTRLDIIITRLESRNKNRSDAWKMLFALRKQRSVARYPTRYIPIPHLTTIPTIPSSIMLGDIVLHYSFAYRVTTITESKSEFDNLPCYVISGDYVGGSLQNAQMFINRINLGTSQGHMPSFQGNDLRVLSVQRADY